MPLAFAALVNKSNCSLLIDWIASRIAFSFLALALAPYRSESPLDPYRFLAASLSPVILALMSSITFLTLADAFLYASEVLSNASSTNCSIDSPLFLAASLSALTSGAGSFLSIARILFLDFTGSANISSNVLISDISSPFATLPEIVFSKSIASLSDMASVKMPSFRALDILPIQALIAVLAFTSISMNASASMPVNSDNCSSLFVFFPYEATSFPSTVTVWFAKASITWATV